MKRRFTSLILTICFLFGLMATPAQAANYVYFTAVDINMLELTDETMPFWYGGYLYVDSSIFNGLTLDYGTLYQSRNISKQTIALYTNQSVRSMVFYIDSGVTIDGDGRSYRAQAILKGDVVFVPLAIVTTFFELRYSTISVNHGTLVRITTEQDPILSDAAFVDAATNWIEVRYEEYLKAQELAAAAAAAAATPTTPEVVPPTQKEGSVIQLAFQVDDTSNVQSWLTLLEETGGQATFFFTAENLEGQGDLLRQILAQGHAIGLMIDALSSLGAITQLSQANQTLYQATTTVSQLVWCDDQTLWEELQQAGYCPITAQIDVSEAGLLSATGATITLSNIDRVDGAATVWLGNAATYTGLSSLLAYGLADNDHFHKITLRE